jgi:hypothetical protein
MMHLHAVGGGMTAYAAEFVDARGAVHGLQDFVDLRPRTHMEEDGSWVVRHRRRRHMPLPVPCCAGPAHLGPTVRRTDQ